QEAKPEAYPNGPIAVYDPYIDLYLEPTVEEAREYDVIMNVASEVRNPFVGTTSSTTENASANTEPEYIHVKWEHNSDIVPDLLNLVKLIDERVMQRKRVLIHCQCGVSRSASLVVAYGLYKDPSLSVQEAYDLVKTRSKWIGPNMNLIMQLQEFRSSL
ncbi:dual specificity phosphatase, partial [Neohortaea acidophila]